jgi:hypothetical protein
MNYLNEYICFKKEITLSIYIKLPDKDVNYVVDVFDDFFGGMSG